MSTTSSYVPEWWRSITGACSPQEVANLRNAVDAAGISRNDKTGVTMMWHKMLQGRTADRTTKTVQTMVNWSAEKRNQFEMKMREMRLGGAEERTRFEFDGEIYVYGYAKYLLEYLDKQQLP